MSADFSKLLDEYPVVPYLDSRDSFIRWIHFIHNKINAKLEKPTISLSQFYENYYNEYKPSTVKMREANVWKERAVYFCILFVIIGITAYLYNK
jgi:pyruvate-formate lyase-activating enzyme